MPAVTSGGIVKLVFLIGLLVYICNYELNNKSFLKLVRRQIRSSGSRGLEYEVTSLNNLETSSPDDIYKHTDHHVKNLVEEECASHSYCTFEQGEVRFVFTASELFLLYQIEATAVAVCIVGVWLVTTLKASTAATRGLSTTLVQLHDSGYEDAKSFNSTCEGGSITEDINDNSEQAFNYTPDLAICNTVAMCSPSNGPHDVAATELHRLTKTQQFDHLQNKCLGTTALCDKRDPHAEEVSSGTCDLEAWSESASSPELIIVGPSQFPDRPHRNTNKPDHLVSFDIVTEAGRREWDQYMKERMASRGASGSAQEEPVPEVLPIRYSELAMSGLNNKPLKRVLVMGRGWTAAKRLRLEAARYGAEAFVRKTQSHGGD